jgi:antitoxin component YwqK of YwqJK toxin-antitoxin module
MMGCGAVPAGSAILRPVTKDATPAEHVEHYDNGVVKLRGAHLDGEMHGEWAFYRRDGSLMRSGAFDRGRQVGIWQTYDRSGAVVKETVFPDRPG